MASLVFLGRDWQGGVSIDLRGRLQVVEQDLAPDLAESGSPGVFTDWAGVREPHRATHPGGNDTPGNAIDVNYQTNPYIATRSARSNGCISYGGETPAAAGIARDRVLATVVYDRATAFFVGGGVRKSAG